MSDISKLVSYTYRSACGTYIVEKSYDFFDDAPDFITEADHQYERIPTQPTKGWVNVEYISANGKESFDEFWRINDAPDTVTRNGVVYTRQFGVPSQMDSFRTGSSLLNKCDTGFQDLMKHAHRRAPKSELDKRF